MKWSIQKRVSAMPLMDSSSQCSQNINHDYVEPPEKPSLSRRGTSFNLRTLLASKIGDEGGKRSLSREDTEDKASLLRDEKLIEAATPDKSGLVPSRPETDHHDTQQLTIGNLGKLEQEQEVNRKRDDTTPDSLDVENPQCLSSPIGLKKEESGSTDESGLGEMYSPVVRPALGKRKDDSDVTVTKNERNNS